MPQLLLDLLLGFGIGLALSLLGGGGSILTVPALVYLVGQSPQAAVTTSLAIVGANSVLGAYFHNLKGACNWSVALVFGGAGMAAAYLAAGASHRFSPAALMTAFAVLMLLIAGVMLAQKGSRAEDEQCTRPKWPAVLAGGAAVGLLTGVLGVGGGFLIVPALVLLVGLPMSQAVGTSLIIIAANSFAGLAGHLGTPGFNLSVTLVFTAAGLAGTFAGSRLAHRLPAKILRQGFAIFVIILAVFLLADNLPEVFALSGNLLTRVSSNRWFSF
jgi:uncharacterized membrane protein YfcA